MCFLPGYEIIVSNGTGTASAFVENFRDGSWILMNDYLEKKKNGRNASEDMPFNLELLKGEIAAALSNRWGKASAINTENYEAEGITTVTTIAERFGNLFSGFTIPNIIGNVTTSIFFMVIALVIGWMTASRCGRNGGSGSSGATNKDDNRDEVANDNAVDNADTVDNQDENQNSDNLTLDMQGLVRNENSHGNEDKVRPNYKLVIHHVVFFLFLISYLFSRMITRTKSRITT